MGFRRYRPAQHCMVLGLLLALCPTGGCKQGAWSLWDAYQAHFIDGQGRVIDHTGGDRTTSEGQAYAMFFALADNDRPQFDKLLGWTQANMGSNDLNTHLPSWLWGKDKDGAWKALDAHSAADADVWMAYDLLEAGRLWNVPAYTDTGRAMLGMIAKTEVMDLPGFGLMLMPGPVGWQHDQTWTLNPSYLPVFLFERFAKLDPSGPWQQIALNVPRLLEASARHGFAMDWVNYIPGDGFYPSPGMATGNKDSDVAGGSYDAIRVYLWAGMMDPGGMVRPQVLSAVPGMSGYLATHDAPPEHVSDQGVPQPQDGPVGFSAALLPYLRAFPDQSKISGLQTVRMTKMRDAASGLYGKDMTYFDQNLALFSTGFLDGRFRFGAGGELNVEWKR
jgi:endo-1,4-beta-D-glucanase Y